MPKLIYSERKMIAAGASEVLTLYPPIDGIAIRFLFDHPDGVGVRFVRRSLHDSVILADAQGGVDRYALGAMIERVTFVEEVFAGQTVHASIINLMNTLAMFAFGIVIQ